MEHKISDTFSRLFEIKAETYIALQGDMQLRGYDPKHPIILATGSWTDVPVVVDGHTRLRAAKDTNVKPVFITEEFESEGHALAYAIHCQKNRRNMSSGDIARCVLAVDALLPRGGNNNPYGRLGKIESKASQEVFDSKDKPKSNNSATNVAKMVGTSKATVERARAIFADDSPQEIKDAVLNDNMPIKKAYESVRQTKKQAKPKAPQVVTPPERLTYDQIVSLVEKNLTDDEKTKLRAHLLGRVAPFTKQATAQIYGRAEV